MGERPVVDLLRWGLLDSRWLRWKSRELWRLARGRFEGEWELALYPPTDAPRRWPPVRWARCLIAGHLAIAVAGLATGWWMVPIVVSLTPLFGNCLFSLCNNTQHIGLQDNVADFRLCCRTFRLNLVVRFLYWQMNYHIEHQMFAAVPCNRLARLHELIRSDLPPCADGLAAVWREIGAIVARQQPTQQFNTRRRCLAGRRRTSHPPDADVRRADYSSDNVSIRSASWKSSSVRPFLLWV